ncbi:MAG TPA: YhgN family NAAT transporter, partial [Vicinamibacterales bacterium]
MDVTSAVVTLFLVMDPLGNVPLFLSVLRTVPPERRRKVLVRELFIAYGVLVFVLLIGDALLRVLGLEREAVSMAGGIVLFLIAMRMIFPGQGSLTGDQLDGEPFVVPLAVPLVAGPSAFATLLLFRHAGPSATATLLLVVTIAWALSAVILYFSTFFYRVLGERGLIAMERLMGMLLVMMAVQMLMNGFTSYLQRSS